MTKTAHQNAPEVRKKHFSPLGVLIILLTGVIACIIAWSMIADERTRHKFEWSRQNLPRIASKISGDNRFKGVTAEVSGYSGKIILSGDVETREDLEMLRLLMNSSHEPIRMRVKVQHQPR